MGGEAVASLTGHAHVKATMRRADAVYGGEMSAHHYFRDFMYCDSGMIPWLLIAEHVCRSGKPLSELVGDMRRNHPSSGEINFRVESTEEVTARLKQRYAPAAETVDGLDGVSMEFGDWRFNLRASNTEPLLRLNVETLDCPELSQARVAELTEAIQAAA